MSKKLLKEGTVRKFMKLANIGTYADSFVNETFGEPVDEEEEDNTLEEEALLDDEGLGDEGAEDAGELEPEPAPEGGEAQRIMQAVINAIVPVAEEEGVTIEVEGDGGSPEDAGAEDLDLPPEEDAADLGPPEDAGAEDLDLPPEEDAGLEEDEGAALYEAIGGLLEKAGIEIVDDEKINEDIIKRVSGRVARRLIKEFL
jgi:hypothetical protein